MRVFLIVLPASHLISGCTSIVSTKHSAGGETTPAWRVKMDVFNDGDGDISNRLAWLERSLFDSSEDATTALMAAAASTNVELTMAPDEDTHVLGVRVVVVPALEQMITKFDAEDAALLRMIHASPLLTDIYSWNPAALIASVNALWRLGEEKALKLIDAYINLGFDFGKEVFGEPMFGLSDAAYSIVLVLYSGDLLAIQPRIGVGSFEGCSPVCTINDIPFLTHGAHTSTGMPEPIQNFIERCQREGTWRATELAPAGSPFVAERGVEKRLAETMDIAAFDYGIQVTKYRLQALRCIDGERLNPRGGNWFTCEWMIADSRYKAWETLYADLKWDAKSNRFK
jgi:hypothetical protein